jgi:hypothetical protein
MRLSSDLAAQRTGRSAAWHRPATVAEAPKVDARRLPGIERNTLCHVRCSALLGDMIEGCVFDDEGANGFGLALHFERPGLSGRVTR